MKVLLDTPIWSFSLRRRRTDLAGDQIRIVSVWTELVRRRAVVLVGPVRQEVLSGVRDAASFDRLRDVLRGFPDEAITTSDYEEAARYNNLCRAAGVAATAVDLLICAVSVRLGAEVLTTDRDFKRYARHLPLRLADLAALAARLGA